MRCAGNATRVIKRAKHGKESTSTKTRIEKTGKWIGWIFTALVILLVWKFAIIPFTKKGKEKQGITPFNLQNSILLGLQITPPLFGFLLVGNKEVTDVLGNVWPSQYVYESSAMVGLLALVFAMLPGIFTYFHKKSLKSVEGREQA